LIFVKNEPDPRPDHRSPNKEKESTMKKLLTGTALALALTATPALARCHGNQTPDGWDLKIASWTRAELYEIGAIGKAIKAIDPSSSDYVADIAAVIDRIECSGIEHANAVKDVVSRATARAACGRPGQALDPVAC
jgi:hypothetical protein